MTFRYTHLLKTFVLFVLTAYGTHSAKAATNLQYGDQLIATIDLPGEKDVYTFSGTTGDRIWIRMRDADSPVDACIQLLSPTGQLLGEHCRDGGIVSLRDIPLPETGTYTILASDNRDNDTGAYGLAIEVLNNPQYAKAINCGDDWSANLQNSVEIQAYRFTAVAGEMALLRMRSANTSLESEIAIYDPNGNLLATEYSSHLAQIGPLTLPISGTYQIMVTDYNGNDVGAYGISFQLINRIDCIPVLNCGEQSSVFGNNGEIVDFKINQLAELDAYHFYAQPGDAIVLQMYSPQKGFEVSLRLYDNKGNLLAFPTPAYGLVRLEYNAFETSGDYVILVGDNNGNDLSQYGLFLERVNSGGCGISLNCANQQDVSEIKEYGYMKSYAFSAQAGATTNIIVIPHEQIGLDPRVVIYAPNGDKIFDATSYGSVHVNNLTLPQEGTYAVLVSDDNGNDLGAFDLEISTDANLDLQAPVLICRNPEAEYFLENGSLTIDPNDFIIEAYDACGAVLISADITTFNCENIGENWMNIKAEDESGNTTTRSLKINIKEVNAYCVADYCEAKGNSTTYEWIEKVSFAGQGIPSGNNGGYGDFTDNNIKLYRNAEYGIYLTPGYPIIGVFYQRYWRAWIDWNRDGDFDDAGELILEKQSQETVKATFTTPMAASGSGIKMRVMFKYGAYPTPCETFDYGEVEDYLITVVDEPVCESLPDDWYHATIGETPIPGAVCYESSNSTFNISGSGKNISGTSDEFYYVYTKLCGDGDIIAKVSSMTYPGENALSGIMFRKDLKEGSKNISLLASEDRGIIYQARERYKSNTIFEEHEGEAPTWIKLERRANWYTGYISKDGQEWELVCPFELKSMGNCLYVGLAVSSNNPEAVNHTVFENVKVVPAVGNNLNGRLNDVFSTIERSNDETVDRQNALTSVRVFPNPVNDFARVDCPACEGQATTLKLYSIRGELVWENQLASAPRQIICDVSTLALPQGTYFLSVQTGKSTNTQKVLVQSAP